VDACFTAIPDWQRQGEVLFFRDICGRGKDLRADMARDEPQGASSS
jgi:hypothetical protein